MYPRYKNIKPKMWFFFTLVSSNFLSRNKEYFSTQICGEKTPMKFIHRIGALNNSEFISGLVAVIELWK
jgi:hypothetical protein